MHGPHVPTATFAASALALTATFAAAALALAAAAVTAAFTAAADDAWRKEGGCAGDRDHSRDQRRHDRRGV